MWAGLGTGLGQVMGQEVEEIHGYGEQKLIVSSTLPQVSRPWKGPTGQPLNPPKLDEEELGPSNTQCIQALGLFCTYNLM